VNYKNVNPTYTINAPYGSEGKGGSVLTEWCDNYGGYINWTTNFFITGPTTNVSLQQEQDAQNGIMAAGESQAVMDENGENDWRHTGWVIFLFCLLAILGTVFLLALARLWCRRNQAKNHASADNGAAQRRASVPTGDFQSIEGESPPRPSQVTAQPVDP
jgi:preprotein translocase subunit SecG